MGASKTAQAASRQAGYRHNGANCQPITSFPTSGTYDYDASGRIGLSTGYSSFSCPLILTPNFNAHRVRNVRVRIQAVISGYSSNCALYKMNSSGSLVSGTGGSTGALSAGQVADVYIAGPISSAPDDDTMVYLQCNLGPQHQLIFYSNDIYSD